MVSNRIWYKLPEVWSLWRWGFTYLVNLMAWSQPLAGRLFWKFNDISCNYFPATSLITM